MNVSCTCHRHTLVAAGPPDVEGKGDVQLVFVLAVAAAHQIGVHVVVGTFGIAESTPRDGHEVSTLGDIEITILSVGKLAMVHPQMGGSCAGYQVLSANVARAGAYKLQIAYDDVAATADFKDAGIAV